MVVAGLTSFNQRIEESVRFMEWGFNAWQSRPLLRQGQRIGEARVQLGGVAGVGLVAPRNLAVTYPAGLGQNLRARIVYQGPVKAPIAAGPAYRRPRRRPPATCRRRPCRWSPRPRSARPASSAASGSG